MLRLAGRRVCCRTSGFGRSTQKPHNRCWLRPLATLPWPPSPDPSLSLCASYSPGQISVGQKQDSDLHTSSITIANKEKQPITQISPPAHLPPVRVRNIVPEIDAPSPVQTMLSSSRVSALDSCHGLIGAHGSPKESRPGGEPRRHLVQYAAIFSSPRCHKTVSQNT